jgi:hypothetical protein
MSTKEIPLKNGGVALVDEEDFERLAQYPWRERKYENSTTGYVMFGRRRGGRKARYENVLMHREVMGAQAGQFVDHINGNGLDNRKSNLRIVTTSQNLANRPKTRMNRSGFKGVGYLSRIRKWQARICVNYEQIYLGVFETPQEAARAYDKAAIQYFGEYAGLNFSGGTYGRDKNEAV